MFARVAFLAFLCICMRILRICDHRTQLAPVLARGGNDSPIPYMLSTQYMEALNKVIGTCQQISLMPAAATSARIASEFGATIMATTH